ncbi:MAG: PilZ domain-containing protein [Candidatus Omnitrophota bacterium]
MGEEARFSRQERRRRKRIDVTLPIRIEYRDGHALETRTKNISTLGTYIESEKEIPLGTLLEISIDLSYSNARGDEPKKKVVCRGVAFRCYKVAAQTAVSRYGIGIFFRSFQERGEGDLSEFIEYTLQEEKKKGTIITHIRKQNPKTPA